MPGLEARARHLGSEPFCQQPTELSLICQISVSGWGAEQRLGQKETCTRGLRLGQGLYNGAEEVGKRAREPLPALQRGFSFIGAMTPGGFFAVLLHLSYDRSGTGSLVPMHTLSLVTQDIRRAEYRAKRWGWSGK